MEKYKVYNLITIVITLCVLSSCGSKGAPTPSPLPSPILSISDALTKADTLFKQREDVSKLRDAVNLVSQVRNPDNRNFDVEAAFAKYNLFLGRQTSDSSEKQKAFDAGEAGAKIASRLQPDKPDGYFWFGANLGEESKLSPVTVGIKSVDDIRAAMNKVIEIDPGFQGASAYDILAQVELNTRLFGGKPEKAVEYLEKAVSIEKNNTYLYLHLAEAYLATKQPDKAKQQLNHVLTMKPDPDYLPEHKAAVEEAKKMLASKF
jgi:Putative Zn-dependent protease, contains TPR repeats